jgi:Holliday junction resolvase RusA-like endonuclease
MIQVTLPYPPSVNHYWRHVGPRVLISRAGREFREHVRSVLAAWGGRPMAGPLRLVVDLFPPDRRRRDCDNALKALLDALQHGGAYADDSQIVKLEVSKHGPVAGGETVVRVEEWDSPDDAAALVPA